MPASCVAGTALMALAVWTAGARPADVHDFFASTRTLPAFQGAARAVYSTRADAPHQLHMLLAVDTRSGAWVRVEGGPRQILQGADPEGRYFVRRIAAGPAEYQSPPSYQYPIVIDLAFPRHVLAVLRPEDCVEVRRTEFGLEGVFRVAGRAWAPRAPDVEPVERSRRVVLNASGVPVRLERLGGGDESYELRADPRSLDIFPVSECILAACAWKLVHVEYSTDRPDWFSPAAAVAWAEEWDTPARRQTPAETARALRTAERPWTSASYRTPVLVLGVMLAVIGGVIWLRQRRQ